MLVEPAPQVLRVSHSMAEAYMGCEKRYEFAHVEKLQPKKTPAQLALGTYGHKVFEVFFKAIKEGMDSDTAQKEALSWAYQDKDRFMTIGKELIHWFDTVWPTLGWKILEVEKTYYLRLNEDTEYPFTVDLLVEVNG